MVARACNCRNSASTGPNATERVSERTKSVPPAGDGDRRPLLDGERLERRLAKPGQAAVAGDAQVDRDDPLANQAVSQVAGHVGLAFARVEVAAGGLDGQAQGPAQLAEPLPLEHGQPAAESAEGIAFAADGRAAGPAQIGRDSLVVTELRDHLVRIVIPGPLLELKTQSRQLFLEDAAALDIVGDDRPRRPVDEQQDRALLASPGTAPDRRRT